MEIPQNKINYFILNICAAAFLCKWLSCTN